MCVRLNCSTCIHSAPECAISVSLANKAADVLQSESATQLWPGLQLNRLQLQPTIFCSVVCVARRCWNRCNTHPQPGGAGVAFRLAPAPAVQPGLFKPAGTEAPTDAALIGYQSDHPVSSVLYGGQAGSHGQSLD